VTAKRRIIKQHVSNLGIGVVGVDRLFDRLQYGIGRIRPTGLTKASEQDMLPRSTTTQPPQLRSHVFLQWSAEACDCVAVLE